MENRREKSKRKGWRPAGVGTDGEPASVYVL